MRLQFSAVRIAEAAILNVHTSIQDNHSSTNPEMASTEITVSKDEPAENLNQESNKVSANNDESVSHRGGIEAHDRLHAKKDDDATVTTAAESLGDPNVCESVCEEKYFPLWSMALYSREV